MTTNLENTEFATLEQEKEVYFSKNAGNRAQVTIVVPLHPINLL